jgi:hypothetical protein|nr:MAG TPA: hypothetical protein [Caudoviricetes sp.]
MGLKVEDLENLTEGMIYDLLEEKMIDNSENDENIEVITHADIDTFFPINF